MWLGRRRSHAYRKKIGTGLFASPPGCQGGNYECRAYSGGQRPAPILNPRITGIATAPNHKTSAIQLHPAEKSGYRIGPAPHRVSYEIHERGLNRHHQKLSLDACKGHSKHDNTSIPGRMARPAFCRRSNCRPISPSLCGCHVKSFSGELSRRIRFQKGPGPRSRQPGSKKAFYSPRSTLKTVYLRRTRTGLRATPPTSPSCFNRPWKNTMKTTFFGPESKQAQTRAKLLRKRHSRWAITRTKKKLRGD